MNRKPYQNVNRWFTTIINQPQVKTVIGDFKLCDKMAEFDAKKFAEFQGKFLITKIYFILFQISGNQRICKDKRKSSLKVMNLLLI